jgi:hypothetical protein
MEHLSRCRSFVGDPGGEFLFWRDFERYVTGLGRKPQPLCLREREALATLRHIYLGSFFMDRKDITSLSLGANWNFFRRTGLL